MKGRSKSAKQKKQIGDAYRASKNYYDNAWWYYALVIENVWTRTKNMKMHSTPLRKTDIFIALTTAWLALAVLFAGIFVIAEHDHEHIDVNGHHVPTSENCHICFEIQIALRLIEAFGRLGVSIALIGFMAYILSLVKAQLIFNPFNPITLKVKFNC